MFNRSSTSPCPEKYQLLTILLLPNTMPDVSASSISTVQPLEVFGAEAFFYHLTTLPDAYKGPGVGFLRTQYAQPPHMKDRNLSHRESYVNGPQWDMVSIHLTTPAAF